MLQSFNHIIERLENAIDSDDVILIGENISITCNKSEVLKIQIKLNDALQDKIKKGLDHWPYTYLINYLSDNE